MCAASSRSLYVMLHIVSSAVTVTNVNSYIVDFYSNSNYAKKRDFLSKKRESGKTLKKREFTPESGSVDTYDCMFQETKRIY